MLPDEILESFSNPNLSCDGLREVVPLGLSSPSGYVGVKYPGKTSVGVLCGGFHR